MNTYLNLANTNLALGVKNLVLGFFCYTKFLDLADLEIFTDLVLFVSTIPISSTSLPLLPNLLIALLLLINTILIILLLLIVTNWIVLLSPVVINLVEDLSFMIFNMEVNYTIIKLKSEINY